MNETLEHHGILGMKWGVRRYQNKDGTWTKEGKEHRAEGSSQASPESTADEGSGASSKTADQTVQDISKKLLTEREMMDTDSQRSINAAKTGLSCIKAARPWDGDDFDPESKMDQEWFLIEDQTFGLPQIADLANQGYDEKEINKMLSDGLEAYEKSKYANGFNGDKGTDVSGLWYLTMSGYGDGWNSDNINDYIRECVNYKKDEAKREAQPVEAKKIFTQKELDYVLKRDVSDSRESEQNQLMVMEMLERSGIMDTISNKDFEREVLKFEKDPHNYVAPAKDETKHSDDSSEDILSHHGILGMKWGIRRYQNPDGSLTAAGRKRYGDDTPDGNSSSSGNSSDTTPRTPAKSASEMTDQELQSALNRLRMEQQYNELTGAKSSNQYQNQQNFSTPPSNTGNLSNAELQAYITRLDMEKRYAQLTAPPPKEVSAGKKFMNDVVGPAINQVAKAFIVASLSKALGLKGDGDNGGNNNNGGNKNKGNNNNDDNQYKSIKKELNDLKSMMGSQRKQDNDRNQKKESSVDSDSESNNSLPEPRNTETQTSNTHRDSIFAAARDAVRNAREQRREQEREQRRQESREQREKRNASWSAFLDGLERQSSGRVNPVTKSYETKAQSYFNSYLSDIGNKERDRYVRRGMTEGEKEGARIFKDLLVESGKARKNW